MILVHCTAVPFAAVVEWAWLDTAVTPQQFFCALLILMGVVIALAPDQRLKLSRAVLLSGIIYGIVAGFGQGMGAVLSRKAYAVAELVGPQNFSANDGITAAYQRILAGWVIAAVSYVILKKIRQTGARSTSEGSVFGSSNHAPGKWRRAWPWILSNALAGPAVGVSCLQLALATTPTAVVLPIIAMTPLVVIPFARLTEGDKPGARSLLGGVLAVVGAALLTWARFRS
jgi:drug/metabolite transporter (DMT)-like permease